MGLDIYFKDPTATYEVDYLLEFGITHNLYNMAEEAGIGKALWNPYTLLPEFENFKGTNKEEYDFEETHPVEAELLEEVLEKGLKKLKKRPDFFKTFDSPNGWGNYDTLVRFTEQYLNGIYKYPKAFIITSR